MTPDDTGNCDCPACKPDRDVSTTAFVTCLTILVLFLASCVAAVVWL